MKKMVVAGVCGLLFAGVVHAAEWWPVESGSSSVWFIDRPSVKTVSGSKIFWVRQEFKSASEGDELKYSVMKWAAHCKSNTIQALSFVDYAADGHVIKSGSKPAPSADEIIPDSVGESMYKVICGLKAWPYAKPYTPKEFTEWYFTKDDQPSN